MKQISIQLWDNNLYPNANVWDDIKPIFLEVKEAGEVAQSIATTSGWPVRMTYYNDATGNEVGRNNGHYFHPKSITRFSKIN